MKTIFSPSNVNVMTNINIYSIKRSDRSSYGTMPSPALSNKNVYYRKTFSKKITPTQNQLYQPTAATSYIKNQHVADSSPSDHSKNSSLNDNSKNNIDIGSPYSSQRKHRSLPENINGTRVNVKSPLINSRGISSPHSPIAKNKFTK